MLSPSKFIDGTHHNGGRDASRNDNNANDNNNDDSSNEKRSVSFGQIEIREYERCLETHPGTTRGPSLSIGWSYTRINSFDLVEFEEARQPTRKHLDEMQLPPLMRAKMLMDSGNCSRQDIRDAIKQTKSLRHQRQISYLMQEFEPWHIFLESLKRKLARLRTGVSNEEEQKRLWENAREYSPESSPTA